METKKSLKADLEKGKTIHLLMGIVVATAALFVSFEWGTGDVKLLTSAGTGPDMEIEEMLPITRPETPPPPPPPASVVIDILNVVEDLVEIEDVDIMTTEDNLNTAQIATFVPTVVDDEEEDVNKIHVFVEEMPSFPGGEKEMLLFINRSIKYPVIAQENGIQGRVICTFVVDRTGKVTDAEVFRSIDPSLDKEALRVVNSMPNWKPGKQNGKPVRVKYTIPITFRLQ